MKKILVFFTLLLLSSPFLLNAQEQGTTIGEVAYILGRQQVLVQQIAQAYMATELKYDAKVNEELKKKNVAIFNGNLDKLQEFKATGDLNNAIENMIEAWDDFLLELTSAPQKEDVLELVKFSAEVLKHCDIALQKLEKLAEKNDSPYKLNLDAFIIFELAERQNALSQHAILYYLAFWNGVTADKLFTDLFKVVTEYEANYFILSDLSSSNAEVRSRLAKSLADWKLAEKIITNLRQEPKRDDLKRVMNIAALLYTDSESLAEVYRKIMNSVASNPSVEIKN